MKDWHVYLMAGFPGKQLPPGSEVLHAGGLVHLIERVEKIGLLEHGPIQARKEGLFVMPSGSVYGEEIGNLRIHMSDRLIEEGITDNWLNENTSLGNAVSCLKASADYETKLVNHECGRTQKEILMQEGILDYSLLRMEQVHDFTEGWSKYEPRWRSGKCPDFTHLVHMTTLLFDYELPVFAYRRILDVVEEAAAPLYLEAYQDVSEPGKYLSTTRVYDGGVVHIKSNQTPKGFEEEKYAVPQHS